MKGSHFSVVLRTATLLLVLSPEGTRAEPDPTPIHITCPGISPESAAAFEARARAELLVRGLRGSLRVHCGREVVLTWTRTDGASRSARPSDLTTDAMLTTLQSLLDEAIPERPPSSPESSAPLPPSEPSRSVQEPDPKPTGDVRLGTAARLLKDEPAVGAGLTAALNLQLLSVTASGHLTRGLKSFGNVSLHIAEARIGAELVLIDLLRLGVAAGAGRPFTTAPGGVSPVGESRNPWFGEAQIRAATPVVRAGSVRFDLGAELTAYSRTIRMQVDRTEGYDFNLVPAIFLEAAFELP